VRAVRDPSKLLGQLARSRAVRAYDEQLPCFRVVASQLRSVIRPGPDAQLPLVTNDGVAGLIRPD
jgi:hypothetical protein